MKGSLRKRAGAWELRVDAGMVNGRRVQKSRTYRGTKKEAEAELRRMVTVAERGSDFSADKITFGAHANRWFDGKRALKPRATARYRELLDRHILPVIGSLPLTKLRPDHVQDVLNEARASGLSEQTALHIYRCLFAVLRQAVQLDLLWRNPAEAVEAPQPERREVEPMKVEILERALSVVATSDLLMPTLIAVGAGMRRGEVLGLRWRDLDFETGTVRLSQTVQTDPEQGWTFTGTRDAQEPRLSPAVVRPGRPQSSQEGTEPAPAALWPRVGGPRPRRRPSGRFPDAPVSSVATVPLRDGGRGD